MPGRLSNSSSPTQATGPGSAVAHKARAIVLPEPGGPVTIVSGHHRVPSAISLVIRGRGTAQCGTSGGVIFEVRIGSTEDTVARRPRVDAWLAPSAVIYVPPGRCREGLHPSKPPNVSRSMHASCDQHESPDSRPTQLNIW